MHLVLEQSPTPIYQRLIAGLCRASVAAGHRISLLDPTDFIAGSLAGSPAGCLEGDLTRLALGACGGGQGDYGALAQRIGAALAGASLPREGAPT